MDEKWLPIEGYEGLYEISTHGNIRSLEPEIERNDGKINHVPARTRVLTDVNGYLYCSLSREGRDRRFAVHRLVAKAFLPNPDNKPEVNHKDGNKHNNHVWNLEWCTRSENQRHAISFGLWKCGDLSGKNNPMYGKHHSESAKTKIAEVHRGHEHTQETKKRMSLSHKGKKFSEDHKRKISESVSNSKRGLVWINNGNSQKCVQPSLLPEYLENGWSRGRLKKATI